MFQPIVRLEDRTVAGFEALPRWRHPRLGLLGPERFLFARRRDATRWSRSACSRSRPTARELAAWQKALEVDAADLRQHQRLVAPVARPRSAQRRAHGAQPPLRAARHAEARTDREPGDGEPGIRAAAAAPGARDSAPAWRSTISAPATPRSAISSAIASTRSRSTRRWSSRTASGGRPSILRSVIAMAHDLGMDVITEGAETESDAVELSQLGCEFAQGYAFGEPMTRRAPRAS